MSELKNRSEWNWVDNRLQVRFFEGVWFERKVFHAHTSSEQFGKAVPISREEGLAHWLNVEANCT